MKTNVAVAYPAPQTHEGATAQRIGKLAQLRRSVLACLLWEDTFYESGVSIAERIAAGVGECNAQDVADLAVEARSKFKLRHVPLLIAKEMLRYADKRPHVAKVLANIIQRPDELTEFLSLYYGGPKKTGPLAAQAKKGLAYAFQSFNEYQLAKWNKDGGWKLRDVLFLTHAKPLNEEQAALWKRLVEGNLATPDTWEVELSASKDKKASWERLLVERKLGGLALLRNLRNMLDAGIEQDKIGFALAEMKTDRILPFRFIAAARHAPKLEPQIEQAMLSCLEKIEKLPGKTAIIVDNSGSMNGQLSSKSDLTRRDAACALAILIREVCQDVVVIGFGNESKVMPPRRGFALRDVIVAGPGGGTYTDKALALAEKEGYDRIIVVTDEQSHETIRDPKSKLAYFINVAVYQNGIGYGKWNHIDGFSEAILDFIVQSEQE